MSTDTADTTNAPVLRGIELDPGDAVAAAATLGNVIYAFTAQGHVYKFTPNPLTLSKLLTPFKVVATQPAREPRDPPPE